MFYGRYRSEDPYNSLHLRNIKNTSKDEYNCAGYALGCFSWYCPGINCLSDLRCTKFRKKSLHEQTMYFVNYILQDFPTLRLINSIEQVQKDDEVIAFRLSSYIDDFHFMVRKHGKWLHKQGGKSTIDKVTQNIALHESWFNDYGNEYDGEIVLMVKTI